MGWSHGAWAGWDMAMGARLGEWDGVMGARLGEWDGDGGQAG